MSSKVKSSRVKASQVIFFFRNKNSWYRHDDSDLTHTMLRSVVIKSWQCHSQSAFGYQVMHHISSQVTTLKLPNQLSSHLFSVPSSSEPSKQRWIQVTITHVNISALHYLPNFLLSSYWPRLIINMVTTCKSSVVFGHLLEQQMQLFFSVGQSPYLFVYWVTNGTKKKCHLFCIPKS